MNPRWKPILALLVLPPLLTELLTVNATISSFFQPRVFLVFVTFGYGFPVLVIREAAVRKNLGLSGLFILGLIYGLYNEALVARTIFHPFHSPFDVFAAYGVVFNIRIPGALLMTFWHALYAVLYPILFVHYLFLSDAKEPWMSKKTALILGVASVAFGVLSFFSGPPQNPRGEFWHFIFILANWLLLGLFLKYFKHTPRISCEKNTGFSWKYPAIGAAAHFGLFLIPLVFIKLDLNPIIFVIYFLCVAIVGMHNLSNIPDVSLDAMVLVAVGAEISAAFFTLFLMLSFGKAEHAAPALVFIVVFAAAALALRRNLR